MRGIHYSTAPWGIDGDVADVDGSDVAEADRVTLFRIDDEVIKEMLGIVPLPSGQNELNTSDKKATLGTGLSPMQSWLEPSSIAGDCGGIKGHVELVV